MLARIIPNLRLNETNEFQDDFAQPILIGEHKGDKQNSLSHLKTGFGITVIGCGLSGMITALSFAARGINSTIIERQNIESPSFFNDIRTTALTD